MRTLQAEAHGRRDTKRAAKGYAITFLGSIFGRGFNFLKQVVIARFLGVEIFGLYTIGFVVVKTVELLARLGLNGGALRFVPIYRDTDSPRLKGLIFSALIIPFFNGILIGALLYLLAPVLSSPLLFNKPELENIIRVFAFGVPFLAANTVLIDIIQGFHLTKYSTYIRELMLPGFNLLFIIVCLFLGQGLIWVIWAFTISNIVTLIWGVYFLRGITPCLTDRAVAPSYELKTWLSFSSVFILVGIFNLGLAMIDLIMLGFLRTSADVGVYRAASQIPLFLTSFLFAANTISAPLISELFHHNQLGRLKDIFKSTTRWIFYLSLPVAIVLFFSSREIMSIFGEDFVEGGRHVLIILTVGQLINCCTGTVSFILTMTGNQKIELANVAVTVILNVFLNYLLIPRFGVIGAAISTGLSVTSINIIRVLEVYLIVKIQPYDFNYMKGVFSGVVTAAALMFFSLGVFPLSPVTTLVIKCIIATIVFYSLIFFLGISDEDRFFLDLVKDKLRMMKSGRRGNARMNGG